MEIGLCWYQNKTGSIWTYDLMDHLMVELESIIALAIMIYYVVTNLYELHPTDEQVFNDFINAKKICLAKSVLAIFFNIILLA